MTRYFVNRLLQAALTAVGVMVLVFVMLRFTGDPTTALLPREATAEMRAEFRTQMGFDKPLALQLLDYMFHAVQGDFGRSYAYRLPVITLILERLPATIELALAGLLVAVVVAVPLGVLGAARPGSIWDWLANLVGIIGLATPSFWAGLVFIIVFGVHLRFFPVAGRDGLRSLILPAVTMSIGLVGKLVRITRATMIEVLRQDYIRTALSKGLSHRAVNYRHALRNAAIPIITLIGVNLGYMLGGSVVVETVFSWPGVGWMTYQAISNRDFTLVQGIALFTSWVVLALNLTTDLVYAVLDPRISYQRRAGT